MQMEVHGAQFTAGAELPPARGSRVGLLCNPLSGRAGRRLDAVRKAASAIPGGIFREAGSRLEMVSALDEFAAQGVDLLAVIGGDGTVHAVLSHLFGVESAPMLPMLTIIPAGTTNMTATDLGIRGGPLSALARLGTQLARPGTAPAQIRHVLRVEHAGLLLHGMFFGAGLIAEGVRFFLERVRGRGITGEMASALVMARYLARLLCLGVGNLSEPMSATLCLDQEPPRNDPFLLVFATTLQRLLLGTRPYWGTEPAPVHATAIASSSRRLWRSLPSVIAGKGGALHADDGYVSRNVMALTLQMDGDFVVDGQLYRAVSSQGPVRLAAAGPVRFLSM